ncbi:hypothetical protein COCNU_11G003550 [Cocos nucifera]|uniref:DUF4283 domain-containing protein n=1 Tax=Cocos nucifera TaxID=13894 RepID=A0A8K0IP85_COCNU|nr:hypothetical protein COCNU_11G003550 [Cocos nucifera]
MAAALKRFHPSFPWEPISFGFNSFIMVFPSRDLLDRAAHQDFYRDTRFEFSIKPWPYRMGARPHSLGFRVSLKLIGLPLYAWDVESAQKIIFGFALLETANPRCLEGRDMGVFEISAFYENVEAIPKSIKVTLGDASYKIFVRLLDASSGNPPPFEFGLRSDREEDWPLRGPLHQVPRPPT